MDPAEPRSGIQVLGDYLPSWRTVLVVTAVVGLCLIPGGGAVLAVVGGGLLAVQGGQAVGRAVDRYVDGNQTLTQACLGAAADVSGVNTFYSGFTNRDIATGEHLGLSIAQQRSNITEGAINVAMNALPLIQAGRAYVRGRTPTATRPVVENGPPTSGVRPEAPPPAPGRSAGGSRAGEAGAAENVDVSTPCFPAGTPIRTPFGSTSIERLRPGDLVLSDRKTCPTRRLQPSQSEKPLSGCRLF